MTLQALLDRALAAEYGIALKFPTHYDARYERRRLYAERERLRRTGSNQYDCLSLIIKGGLELHILRRDVIPNPPSATFQECRELKPEDLPNRILSRGKSRFYIS